MVLCTGASSQGGVYNNASPSTLPRDRVCKSHRDLPLRGVRSLVKVGGKLKSAFQAREVRVWEEVKI